MQKYYVKNIIVLLVSFFVFFGIGQKLCNVNQPIHDIEGIWNGKSSLKTQTSYIAYDINAFIKNDKVLLSLVAQTKKNDKFAFQLDLEYVKHTENRYVFSVIDRKTIWLDQIRSNQKLDIPIISHLLVATIVKKNDRQFYFSFNAGKDYSFGVLFEKVI